MASADLEKQGLTKNQPAEQYGSIESTKAVKTASEEQTLLLGRWAVSSDQIYRFGVAAFVIWFLIHRIADIAYLVNIDARFPKGLGHLYPSEAQRLESVSYTRQVLLCGMTHRILVFGVVFALVFLRGFARFDDALHRFWASIATWWETSYLRAGLVSAWTFVWAPFGRMVRLFPDSALGQVAWLLFGRPYTWCANLKHHTVNGLLATDISNRFGFRYSIRELLHGAVYLTLIGALFFTLSAPFIYWMQTLDLKFGFSNSLMVSTKNFKVNFTLGLISMIITGIPQKFMFLCVLQYRLGWFCMWAGIIISMVYAQHNVGMIAGALGLEHQFPTANFAVGRGFPLQQTANQQAPWISLNRLFFPDSYSQALNADAKTKTYYTNDKNKGELVLTNRPDGKWQISGTAWFDPTMSVYAETKAPATNQLADGLRESSWSVGGTKTRMGVRSGKELRDKLFGFASERAIGIGEIYMVDGSHKDARANAFVTGAGNHSIIGLYDTLFLGQRGSDAEEDAGEDTVSELAESKSLIQHASEVVQNVDLEEEDQDKRAPRNSAATEAMNDDEIVAILAHELAHSALRHMEMGMAAQAVTSFMTFATLGWMTQSPLAAAALSLHAPVLHVGACAYDHVVAPPLEGFMKLFTDGLTRHNEYKADAYAARISERYGTGLQTALAKLSVNSNQDPDPPWFFEALHSDHPPFSRRWEHIENVKKETWGNSKTSTDKAEAKTASEPKQIKK